MQYRNVIQSYTRACSNVDRVVVGDFLFWLVIFFGLVLSSKLQDSPIAKGFIFVVSSQSLKRREQQQLYNFNLYIGRNGFHGFKYKIKVTEMNLQDA